jgi:hypothetical protein
VRPVADWVECFTITARDPSGYISRRSIRRFGF